jgi:hypothetical protein
LMIPPAVLRPPPLMTMIAAVVATVVVLPVVSTPAWYTIKDEAPAVSE